MADFNYLSIERKASDQVIELLEQNKIGTPGESIVYRHRDVRAKIDAVPNPYFANLCIRNRLYGTICFSKRRVYSLEQRHEAFYLRYFTFREKLRSSMTRPSGRSPQSQIAKEVHQLMQGQGLREDKDLLLYAYVDPENRRSKKLIEEFGFHRVGDFHTIPFSRFKPKFDAAVQKLEKAQLEDIKKLLSASYTSDRLVFFEYLETRGAYFVIRQDDEIVCGVQAIEDGWEILDLPGFKGKVMMQVVPYLPWLGRLFSPDYRFVFFEHIYCQPGQEHLLERLFESVLAYHKLHSAVICLDPRSSLYVSIQRLNLGLTHRLMGEKQIEIYMKSSEPVLTGSDSSFFISGFDVL